MTSQARCHSADNRGTLSRSEETPNLIQTDLKNRRSFYVMKIDTHECADIKEENVVLTLGPGHSRGCERGE